MDQDGGGAVARIKRQVEPLLLVLGLAERGELAGVEVVEQGPDAPLEGLLDGPLPELGGLPDRVQVPGEVLAGGRGLATRDAFAALLGERLEGGVGRRAEARRGRDPNAE